jgi:hypothetical protein
MTHHKIQNNDGDGDRVSVTAIEKIERTHSGWKEMSTWRDDQIEGTSSLRSNESAGMDKDR